MIRRSRLTAVAAGLCAAAAVALLAASGPQARAAQAHAAQGDSVMPQQRASHVVVVGVSGLTWDTATQAELPELWRLAEGGSVGALVDYAQEPVACPADGWLTLNSAARAQGPRPCTSLPVVTPDGASAQVSEMPQLIKDNQQFHEAPDWGLLASRAACATAVGPGAALALAEPSGHVPAYLPSAAALSPQALARCPLTVVDLGQVKFNNRDTERRVASSLNAQLTRIVAALPDGTLLLVTAPGAAVGAAASPSGPPQLMTVVVSGPGFAGGLLSSSATRRPGIVALTDLTPTVASWLGRAVPSGAVGAVLTSAPRGTAGLGATVAGLRARDAAEQVWITTHGWFYLAYAVLGALAFGGIALICRGAAEDKHAGRSRGRRARWWRAAGVATSAVPLASYLANAAPWQTWAHPAWWLYSLTAAWTVVVAAVALRGPWRFNHGPFGMACVLTLLVLGLDVMTGSHLQLDAPFGLSLLVSGRYYGIGNEALGIYCVSALVAAWWLARVVRRPWGRLAVVAGVGGFAVVASGWPGFGAKAGGTIALVPCLLLLAASLVSALDGEARIGRRVAVPVAVSGLVVFLAFAVLSYFVPAAGVSDMGTFAGNLLHGDGAAVLQRKASANVGSLTLDAVGWLIPVAAIAAGGALWRPAALRLRTLDAAFTALPALRALAWLCWLVLVLGWFADDSGVLVPAVALPFAVPLMVAMGASVSASGDRARYFSTASAGPSVVGRSPR